jgi:hypothetical protein
VAHSARVMALHSHGNMTATAASLKGFPSTGRLAQCATAGNFVLAPMPTADATLLPPPFSSSSSAAQDLSDAEDTAPYPAVPETCRHLEDVGVETVLEAMIVQKRRSSSPSYPAFVELDSGFPRDSHDEAPTRSSQSRGRAPATSEVFLKAR